MACKNIISRTDAQRATLSSPKLRDASRRQERYAQVRAYQAGGGRANASAAQPLKKK